MRGTIAEAELMCQLYCTVKLDFKILPFTWSCGLLYLNALFRFFFYSHDGNLGKRYQK
jgi:hypothetical protein